MQLIPKHTSSLLSTGNTFTRIFYIQPEGDVLVVLHAPFSGSLEITLNGVLEHAIESPPGQFWFAKKGLKGPNKYVLFLSPASNWFSTLTGLGASYTYRVERNGSKVPELSELPPIDLPSLSTFHISSRVLGAHGVHWYLVEWPLLHVKVHRRFKEFFFLYSQICSAFRGTHLYSSVPEPPPKESFAQLLNTKVDDTFFVLRQKQLEVFLKRLLSLPNVMANPDVLDFLGIACLKKSRLVERSTVFVGPEPLGFTLKEITRDKPSFCAQVVRVVDETSCPLHVGDVIYKVNGEPAFDFNLVSQEISARKETEATVVHFLTQLEA